MKIFVFILSIYIFGLNAMPCFDVPEDNALQKTELTQSANNHRHQDSDHCSPFCTCSCCVTPIICQNYIIELNNLAIHTKHITEYKSIYAPTLYSSIWQPPKIS